MSSDGEASDSLFTEPETERTPYDLFRDENGQSCLFYLHPNIPGDSRNALIDQIELHGGTVVDHDRGVDTVLTAVGTNRDAIQRAYHGCNDVEYRRVHVEFSNFIDKCIKKDNFKHRIPRRKPMPGVQPGRGRNSFTPDDDEKLCNWLAQRITYCGEGGRLGMKVYEELIESAEACPELQGWALRHTAASFRERYRKRREKMDKRIDEICKDIVVVPGQLHPQTRALNNLPKKRRAKETSDSEEDEDSEEQMEEEESESDGEVVPEPVRRPSQRHSHPRRNTKRRQSTRSEPVASRKGKEKAPDYDEEPMEDNDDEAEESEEVEDYGHDDIPEEYPPTYRTIQSSQEVLAANQASTSRQRVSFPPPTEPAKKPTSQPRRSQPQPQPTQIASSSSQRVVAPQSNPSPAQSIQPPGSQVPKLAARAPASMQRSLPSVPSPAAEAPFRNTRARSRSVGPTVATRPPPVKRSRKAPPAPEQPIHEEAPQSSQYEDVFAAPIPETVAEELSVANLLTTQDQSVRFSTTVRHPSMGTDDVQTRNQLFGNTSRSPLRPKNTRTAAELLRDFEEASEASITPIAVPRTNKTQIRSLLRNKAPPAAPRAEPHVGQPAPPVPVTPPRPARIHVSDSDSSVATSYPASGTRASALKKDLRRKEMMTPYRAPPGTRAAAYNN